MRSLTVSKGKPTRNSLVKSIAAVAVLMLLPCVTSAAAEQARPNILLILADNWRWPTAGVLGDRMARTPAFDRMAREGVLFTHTFNPVPSCSPTRACLLTGRYAHELGERANLQSGFPQDTPVVTQLLRESGYEIGFSGKPWGPGNHEVSGWKENPVGPKFSGFAEFHAARDPSRPFFFWLGNTATATRGGSLPYRADAQAALNASDLVVPPPLMTMRSIRGLLLGEPDPSPRDAVFMERERHSSRDCGGSEKQDVVSPPPRTAARRREEDSRCRGQCRTRLTLA